MDSVETIKNDLVEIAQSATEIGQRANELYDKGIEQGKQAEYDAFWNAYQENGNKTIYGYSFAGTGWNSENYKPKYPIVLNHPASWNDSVGMFMYFDRNLRKPSLEIHEGDIDFSGKLYDMVQMFSNANISVVEMNTIPTILNSMSSTFSMTDINAHKLHTIKIGVREETTYDAGTFRCNSLLNVSFVEGSVIGQNISFQYCDKLTHDSLMNIISVLNIRNNTIKTRIT